jgi:hypothetical protein
MSVNKRRQAILDLTAKLEEEKARLAHEEASRNRMQLKLVALGLITR